MNTEVSVILPKDALSTVNLFKQPLIVRTCKADVSSWDFFLRTHWCRSVSCRDSSYPYQPGKETPIKVGTGSHQFLLCEPLFAEKYKNLMLNTYFITELEKCSRKSL